MADLESTRRLTVIVVADVVGYSRLLEADERGTIAQLAALRKELNDPKIAEYGGHVLRRDGDGTLIEFPSIEAAVRCSVDIQQAMARRNVGVPEDRRIEFRVGIEIGDVIFDEDDFHGTGVNVAARLEGLAEPGGVLVSERVYKEIRNKIDIPFEDNGEQSVKNIAQPVRAYRALIAGSEIGVAVSAATSPTFPSSRGRIRIAAFTIAPIIAFTAVGAFFWQPWAPDFEPVSPVEMTLPLPDEPSIAVLPFANLSGDPQQNYFGDGISEDIITNLSKVSGLFVIARTSTLQYKGKAIDVRRVARELGVRYVLEGSVRKAEGNVRITAQLIDATTGRHLWAERYDRPFSDIFDVQDEVSDKIVISLAVALSPDVRERTRRRYVPNPEAYDFYVQGIAKMIPPSPDNLTEGKILLEKAIETDPDFADPYGYLAFFHFLSAVTGAAASPKEAMEASVRVARKGIEIDDQNAYAYQYLGYTLLYLRQFDEAEAAFEKAIAVAPGDARTRGYYAQYLHFAGNPAMGLEMAKLAYRANPTNQAFTYILGANYRAAGQNEKAVEVLVRRRRLFGRPDPNPDLHLAAAYISLGRKDEAKAVVRDILKAVPHYNVQRAKRAAPYKNPKDLEDFLDAVRAAGLPD